MKKFVVKNTPLVKITAQTPLKIGDDVLTKLPKTYPLPYNTIFTTTITGIKGDCRYGSSIAVKTPLYPRWMDISFIQEVL